MVLKFEKVYFPSVLVTKKRYVGYMYETPGQKRPHFEAKGIEVARRDQCPATVKMQEKALRILFETRDMSQVKEYVASEWAKMMQGGDKLLLKDFIFSKEVRMKALLLPIDCCCDPVVNVLHVVKPLSGALRTLRKCVFATARRGGSLQGRAARRMRGAAVQLARAVRSGARGAQRPAKEPSLLPGRNYAARVGAEGKLHLLHDEVH